VVHEVRYGVSVLFNEPKLLKYDTIRPR